MAGAGVMVREFVPAPALAAGEAAERVLGVVTHGGQHQVARVGPSTYRLTRRFRPMWSLRTTTEICDVSVGIDQATGHTVVLLEGLLPAGTLQTVRLALGGAVPTVTAAPPAYTGPPMPAMSMPPPVAPVAPPPVAPQRAVSQPVAPQRQPSQPVAPQATGQVPVGPHPGWAAQPTAPPTTPMAAAPRPSAIAVEFDDGRRASRWSSTTAGGPR
ncbi:hypothetical protein GCM10009682_55550 [Luedemannella flava]|uniref:Uncharacterized protein n=1 Tax=Luedemannella flava TaxID=349316 RepID=A0ABN2MJS4_9ACTN